MDSTKPPAAPAPGFAPEKRRIRRVLFVCTGNTCRSAMAEAWLREALQREGGAPRPEMEVRSAGIAAVPGLPMAANAARALAGRGLVVPPERHTSRPLTHELVDWADQIVAMTRAHRDTLARRYPAAGAKLSILREWSGEGGDVADPFGGGPSEYQACLETMIPALEAIRKAALLQEEPEPGRE